MADKSRRIILRINKYLPFFMIYFFLNTVGLPDGLTFTSLLAPLFFIWLLHSGERLVIIKFLIFIIPFSIGQYIFYPEINWNFYFRSLLLYFLIYVSIYTAVIAFKKIKSPRYIFDKIIITNFVLTIVALFLLRTSYSETFWTIGWITADSGLVSRLRLLTYEPSYYSTLLIPFLVYAFVNLTMIFTKKNILMLIITFIPLGFSFSMGVISALVISLVIGSILNFKMFFRYKWLFLLTLLLVIAFIGIMTTDNLISLRINNILFGRDSSANVRTYQSFDVAYRIANETDLFFGAGFGQSKLLADQFFNIYWPGLGVVRITNVVATFLAEFGILGLLLRFFVIFSLFFKSKVYTSFYRLILFLFIFIYQFTGSFPTNNAEYLIWVITFIPIFPEFEKLGFRNQASLLSDDENNENIISI